MLALILLIVLANGIAQGKERDNWFNDNMITIATLLILGSVIDMYACYKLIHFIIQTQNPF